MKAFENKTNGVITPIELKSLKYKLMYWAVVAILILITLISLIPALWILLSGFKDVKEIYKIPPDILPSSIDISKLVTVWKKYNLVANYLATFTISIGSVICSVVFPALGGFVLSRLRPKGSKLVFTLLLWTMMLPVQTRLVPTFMVFNDLPLLHISLTNSYLPLWMLAAVNIFDTFLFKNYFDSVSNAIVEAAKIDGCTNLGIFWKIVLPLAKPIIIYICITSINATWSSFMWPMLLIKDDELLPIAVKLYRMKGFVQLDYYMLAIIFGMLPPVVMYLFFQKQILGGVNVGGVKG